NVRAVSIDSQQIRFRQTVFQTRFAQQLRCPKRFWKTNRTIDQKQRPSLDFYIPRISEYPKQPLGMRTIVLDAISLCLEYICFLAYPASRPCFVSPSKTKRKFWFGGR